MTTFLGDFEIVREIGRGGMGVVYEARQTSLNRRVALKVLSGGFGLTPKAVQRFRREAEAAAKLHHTNIVPVYAIGEVDRTLLRDGADRGPVAGPRHSATAREHTRFDPGSTTSSANDPVSPDLAQTGPYAEVAGSSSTISELTSSSLSSGSGYFDTVARMIAEVADAIEYAHQQGVIHRDMKPSNLLLAPTGHLSISDFGLARMLEQPGMTVSGEFVGTPAYMSPEQITAGRTPLDHRTDIYSLGATLYELLTLQPPSTGKQRDQVLAQILHKEPAAPRSVNAKVPVNLETICLKSLEKDPDRRYQTAGAMAEDLRRYINRFAISARRVGPWTRLTKWVKRHPGVAALLGCLTVAVLLVGFFAHQAKLDRDRLRTEQRQAAVENAILEAISGDTEAALQAIVAAEAQGAEVGRLNLLRGMVDYYRGRPKEAIVYLEQADQQLPQSVAVKALLTRAYIDEGRVERYSEMAQALEKLEVVNTEDRLFRALSLAEMAPRQALQILDDAPTRFRQSACGRLGRGMVQTWAALMTGRAEDAELALEYLRQVDLPDNPLLLCYRIRAQQIAARAYEPNDPRRDQAWEAAARDIERVSRLRDNRVAIEERCWYHLVRGEDDTLLEIAQQARRDRAADTFVTEMHAIVLYGRRNFDEALRVLQSGPFAEDQSTPIVFRGVILAAMPGRKDEAEKTIVDAVRACRGSGALAYLAAYLQLLGPEYGPKARQLFEEIRQQSSHMIPTYRDRWYHDLLAFQCGSMDEQTLLKKAGDNRFNQCETHFYIGLRRLAEGNRAEAKACFQRVIDTGVFLFEEYLWCRAFLACIDDPAWMPQVPLAK